MDRCRGVLVRPLSLDLWPQVAVLTNAELTTTRPPLAELVSRGLRSGRSWLARNTLRRLGPSARSWVAPLPRWRSHDDAVPSLLPAARDCYWRGRTVRVSTVPGAHTADQRRRRLTAATLTGQTRAPLSPPPHFIIHRRAAGSLSCSVPRPPGVPVYERPTAHHPTEVSPRCPTRAPRSLPDGWSPCFHHPICTLVPRPRGPFRGRAGRGYLIVVTHLLETSY